MANENDPKTTNDEKSTVPLEYKKWKVGDYVFCTREPDGKPGYGKITRIHLDESSRVPCFTFSCEICGQRRLALFDKIAEKPTPEMLKAVKRATKRGL